MLFTVPQNFEFVKNFFQSLFDVARSSQKQQLFDFTTLRSTCQELFSEVFELGSRSISGNLCRLPHLVAAVKWFFIPLSGAVLTAPTALLEYQTFPRLSTPFLRFLLFQTFPTFLLYREVEVISKSKLYLKFIIGSCFLHSEGPQYKPHAAIDCCTVSSLFRRFPIHSTTNSNHASPDRCKNIDNEIQIFFRLSSVINVFSIPYTPQKRDRQIHKFIL